MVVVDDGKMGMEKEEMAEVLAVGLDRIERRKRTRNHVRWRGCG